jgi:hypothetical protein
MKNNVINFNAYLFYNEPTTVIFLLVLLRLFSRTYPQSMLKVKLFKHDAELYVLSGNPPCSLDSLCY